MFFKERRPTNNFFRIQTEFKVLQSSFKIKLAILVQKFRFLRQLPNQLLPNKLNSHSLIHVFRFCFFSFRSLSSIHSIAKFDNRDRTILIQLKINTINFN